MTDGTTACSALSRTAIPSVIPPIHDPTLTELDNKGKEEEENEQVVKAPRSTEHKEDEGEEKKQEHTQNGRMESRHEEVALVEVKQEPINGGGAEEEERRMSSLEPSWNREDAQHGAEGTAGQESRGVGEDDQNPIFVPYCVDWNLDRDHHGNGRMCAYRHGAPTEVPLVTAHPTKLPEEGVMYFHHPDAGAEHSIAIVVACYNEEQEELHRTLFSLSRQRSPQVAVAKHPRVYRHRIGWNTLIFLGISVANSGNQC